MLTQQDRDIQLPIDPPIEICEDCGKEDCVCDCGFCSLPLNECQCLRG